MKATTLFNRATLAALLASSLLTATIPAQAGRLEDLKARQYILEDRITSLTLQRDTLDYKALGYAEWDNRKSALDKAITNEREKLSRIKSEVHEEEMRIRRGSN